MKQLLIIPLVVMISSACAPTVRVEAGSEPIRIEANITISHEIKIVLEKDVKEVFADEDLF